MYKDVTGWVKEYQPCPRAKVTSQPTTAMQPIPVPQRGYSQIHVDIVAPLPVYKEGLRYFLAIIDRMLEAVPITNIKTETCQDALTRPWVACFSIPIHLIPDQGAQFTSTLWACTCDIIGTHHKITMAYHPQWPQHLPWVLLDINNAPRRTAAKKVYGTNPNQDPLKSSIFISFQPNYRLQFSYYPLLLKLLRVMCQIYIL